MLKLLLALIVIGAVMIFFQSAFHPTTAADAKNAAKPPDVVS